MAEKQLTVKFVRERETKNTVRFAEVPRDPKQPEALVVGTLYVQKAALDEIGTPDNLTVTIQPS
jgi:hypothetical protein